MKRLHLMGIAVGLVLAGCGGDSPEKQLASAKDYLQKKDTKAAVIQIKNVLQQQPESGEARFLLGSTLLKQGDVAGAEVELRKALAAQYAKDDVVPDLARAMLMLGQAKKVVDEFSGTQLSSPAARASLQTSLAAAYAALGQGSASQAALDAALAADKNYVPAQLLDARRKAAARDFEGSLAAVEAVIQADASNSAAWVLKGDVLQYGKGDADAALEAFRKAVAVEPGSLLARYALAAQLMRKGALDEAGQQVEQMKQLAPKHPSTQFMDATLALQKKDFKTARELSLQLVQLAPKDPRVLQLAGAAELGGGSAAQAEIYLSRALQAAPQMVMAKRLLISSYLRTGQPAKALATLNSLDEKRDFDAGMFALAGEVYLHNGDAQRAEQAFAQSLKLDPSDARKRTALAVTHLASGRVEASLDELQDIAGADTGVTADMALISAHLRRQEFAKALAAVDGLERKQPDKPLAANLRGRIQMLQKDTAGARKSFERALAIDPGFFPAIASLATLDMADKRPEDAKKRFEAALAKDPKNVQALVALAQLAASQGAPKEEIARLLNRAVDVNPTDTASRLLLVDLYLRHKDSKQAVATAQSAVTALPTSPELLAALGRAQLVSGDLNQGRATYVKLVALQPLSPQAHVLLAEAQLANKDKAAALQSLRKALELKPDHLEAQRRLIAMQVEDRNYVEATRMARVVQEQLPKSPVGFIIEGDVANAQKSWDAAARGYKAALQLGPVTEAATKLHAVLSASGKTAEANKFAADWQKQHPKDAVFLVYVAEQALGRKDYGAAEKLYLAALELQPNSAVVLNNLAWVTGELHKEGALHYAEKANKLAPDQPVFMDTLATLLAAKGEYGRAVELQSKALAMQPENAGLRMNLAKIYIQAGDKVKAKIELEALARLGERFSAQAEVQTLIGAL